MTIIVCSSPLSESEARCWEPGMGVSTLWPKDAAGEVVVPGDMLVHIDMQNVVLVLDVDVPDMSWMVAGSVTRMLLPDGSCFEWFGALYDFRRVTHEDAG